MTPDRVFQGLVDRGLPAHVAEGIVMNVADESGFDPGINEAAPVVPGSRGGYGLMQWTGPRREALERFAAQSGRPVDDVDLQLDFLMTELSGPERGAFESVMGTSSPGDAAAVFATKFLRPAKQHLDRRVADYTGGKAQDWPLGNALRGPDFNPNAQQQMAQNALRETEMPDYRLPFAGIDPAMFMSKHRYG